MMISCGCGWGHAVPDMAIAASLLALHPKVQISFVSYAEGAEAYRVHRYAVTDLHMPRHPSFLEMIVRCTRLMISARPQIVVVHEEYAAVVAAHALGVPCLFVTDFFFDPSSMAMQALRYASEVIFLGVPGLFTEPPQLRERVYYVGRAVQPFDDTSIKRETLRQELEIPSEATVVLCQPGSWSEAQCPITEVLSGAWELVPQLKHLIWVAGSDYDDITQRFCQHSNVTVLRHTEKLADLMTASDLLITKGSRQTIYEASARGLPSVSISSGLN